MSFSLPTGDIGERLFLASRNGSRLSLAYKMPWIGQHPELTANKGRSEQGRGRVSVVKSLSIS
jgi:hypothetical protein